ncbi:hypothetical protein M0R72_12120 [Candidatus Pacearchaeota archaeon]|nr:hypothetical protein [Candidatus Pacearchaeota archaeon]
MTEVVELICKKLHMPYPNVRIPANTRVAIGPPWIAEALCVRGFFEKVSEDVLKLEREAEYAERKKAEEAQIVAQKAETEASKKEKPKAGSK